jgi:large subunit ribosomal protein L21
VYAIFEDGGRQYKVQQGDIVLVDLRDAPEQPKSIKFDTVLMLGNGASSKIGQPVVPGASVAGDILQEMKMPKVRGVKHRRRKGLLKRWGHRQPMLRVKITGISG